MDWIVEQTIAQLMSSMAAGERSCAEIVDTYLDRIAEIDPGLRSVVEVNPRARDAAETADAARAAGSQLGSLHGIPILLKENIDTLGPMLTTAGSLALSTSMPLEDSTTVVRLRAAGAIILGKTAMSEWAFFRSTEGTSGWSARNGQVRNPFARDRSPGGSSSGSGVAVSANLAAVAIGTETDGSIVSPANASGVVGMKPTVGLTSRAGVIPISNAQDSIGPLGRTVADAASVLTALTGPDKRDSAVAESRGHDYSSYLDPNGLDGARIGVARKFFGRSWRADHVVEAAIAMMRSAGAVIIESDTLAASAELHAAEEEVLLHEFKAGLTGYLATRSSGSPQTLREIIEFNLEHAGAELQHFGQELLEIADERGDLSSQRYLEAKATAARLGGAEGIHAALAADQLDALVAPTSGPSTPIDLINGDPAVTGSSSLAAVAGYPLLSVPAGVTGGLPVGITFMAGRWSEPMLIRLGSGFESVRGPRAVPTFAATIDNGWVPVPR